MPGMFFHKLGHKINLAMLDDKKLSNKFAEYEKQAEDIFSKNYNMMRNRYFVDRNILNTRYVITGGVEDDYHRTLEAMKEYAKAVQRLALCFNELLNRGGHSGVDLKAMAETLEKHKEEFPMELNFNVNKRDKPKLYKGVKNLLEKVLKQYDENNRAEKGFDDPKNRKNKF